MQNGDTMSAKQTTSLAAPERGGGKTAGFDGGVYRLL